MKPVIEVSNLSKQYRLQHEQKAQYGSLRDDLKALLTKPISLITGKSQSSEDFWALHDVSFEVAQGEVVGIIGKNGSGKSTLLKILSRIVEPTSGQAILRGNVASLLEVGTGFHGELSGRENIYFNGSILGMSKREIDRKFHDIVEFSEIEKFLDTPVKFYSSGMYVRLAFAVAAHLEPDVLIVDEVLAVGDAEFQKKSLGKMNRAAKEGRTVLFVSHSMGAVRTLCQKAILLQDGRIKAIGPTQSVIDQYLHLDSGQASGEYVFDPPQDQDARITKVATLDAGGRVAADVRQGQPWSVRADYTIRQTLPQAMISCEIITTDNQVIYFTADSDTKQRLEDRPPARYQSRVDMGWLELAPGEYRLRLAIQSPGKTLYDMVEEIPINIQADAKDIRGSYFGGRYLGLIANTTPWQTQRIT